MNFSDNLTGKITTKIDRFKLFHGIWRSLNKNVVDYKPQVVNNPQQNHHNKIKSLVNDQ